MPILNLATAGDEVRFMLGVDERRELITRLTTGCPAGVLVESRAVMRRGAGAQSAVRTG